MTEKATDLSALMKLEEEALDLRLRTIRAAIDHAGEKGANLEHHTRTLIRRMLPHEYGVGTGFVAHRRTDGTVELSTQLDVVIYDAIHGGTIVDLETIGVWPIEAVYAYVEVKTGLYASLRDLMKQSAALRKWRNRSYAHFVPEADFDADELVRAIEDEKETKAKKNVANVKAIATAVAELIKPSIYRTERVVSEFVEFLPIRSFAVAYEYGYEYENGFDVEKVKERVESTWEEPAHFHGILVPNRCCITSVNAHEAPENLGKVHVETAQPLADFRRRLSDSLATFPRLPVGTSIPFESYYDAMGEDDE